MPSSSDISRPPLVRKAKMRMWASRELLWYYTAEDSPMFTDSRTKTQPLQANSLGLLLIEASEMDRMKKGFIMPFETQKKWDQEKKFTSLYSQNRNVL